MYIERAREINDEKKTKEPRNTKAAELLKLAS